MKRLSIRTFIAIGSVIGLLILHQAGHSQSQKLATKLVDSISGLAPDRIVIKLSTDLASSKLHSRNGIALTGIQSIDALNQRFTVSRFARLFPGSEAVSATFEYGLPRVYRINFIRGVDLGEILRAYASDPNVEYAQPVGIHRLLEMYPNDPHYTNQWNLTKIGCPVAWEITQADSSILLAIIDTGVDYMHPDLGGASPFISGNIWINWAEYAGVPGADDDENGYVDDIRGWDWVDVGQYSDPTPWDGEDASDEDNDPMDFNGHGTHCAGIASAITNNGAGIAGVGWNCQVMPLRVGWSVNYGGSELGLVGMDYCAQAIYYAARNGASAINCSWGSSNSGGINEAVSYATSLGVAVVTAAGNDDLPYSSYLASRYDCIAVAATDPDDRKSSYSCYGFWVDLAAPGGDYPPTQNQIYSTYFMHNSNTHGYDWLCGTSMAAPHVVGLTGLIKNQFPSLGWRDMMQRMQVASDALHAINPEYQRGQLGAGRINAHAALDLPALSTTVTVFSENFNGGLPASWNADPFWREDDPGNRNAEFDDIYEPGTIKVGYDIWDAPFMIIDSDHAGQVDLDATLISPIIDCSIYSDLQLVFDNWFQNYYDGYNEVGDVDLRVNGGAWINIARFESDMYMNIIDAGREIVVPLPENTNFKNSLQFRWHYYNANYDWFWGIDNVKLVGTLMDTGYYVQIMPSEQSSRGEAGDTLRYMVTLRNLGQNEDSYQVSVSRNAWGTSVWDSSGTIPIQTTGSLAPAENLVICIKVEIPDAAAIGDADTAFVGVQSQQDPSVFAEALLHTIVIPASQQIPWFEDFPTEAIDPENWQIISGSPTISSDGTGEPSSPFSLELKGAISGDAIESCAIKLSSVDQAVLKYYYQNKGTDIGDDLVVSYFNGNKWTDIAMHNGSQPDPEAFIPHLVLLPAAAHHGEFKFRFRNEADDAFARWYVDDVIVSEPPNITLSPDSLRVTVSQGDSTSRVLAVGNDGACVLDFSLRVDAPSNFSSQQNFAVRFNQPHPQSSSKAYGDEYPRIFNSDNPFFLAGSIPEPSPENQTRSVVAAPIPHVEPGKLNINTELYFRENFEDGDFEGWTIDDGSYVREITDLIAAAGTEHCFTQIGGANDHYDGVHYAFPACQPEYVSFYIRPATNNRACAYVVIGDDNILLNDGAFFFYASSTGYLTLYPANSSFLYAAATWYQIEFKNIDWTTKTFDYFVDGELIAPALSFRANTTEYFSQIYLYNYHNTQAWWDEISLGENPALTWIKVSPTQGTVAVNDAVDVAVKINAENLEPDSSYHANIEVTSDDPDDQTVNVPVTLYVNPVAYYFQVAPLAFDSSGRANDTLAYSIKLVNRGEMTDSYQLFAEENEWALSFYDASGAVSMEQTAPVAPGAETAILAKVAIPATASSGAADTAQIRIQSAGDANLSRVISVYTLSIGMPSVPPWGDSFPETILDSLKWTYNSGPVEVSDGGLNEPSPPYSLNLDGDVSGGDEIRSQYIDLSGDSLFILTYQYQRGAGDTAGMNDALFVDYFTASGSWVNLKQYFGSEMPTTSFTLQEIQLPADANHPAFRLRFRNLVTPGFEEDWYIDDILISRPPAIAVTPESYHEVVVAGDSLTCAPIEIANTGESDLRFRILSVPVTGTDFEPATRQYPDDFWHQRLEKDQLDPRQGAPVVYNAGGPDQHGYYWLDSDEGGCVGFNWIDIANIGTQIPDPGDDENLGPYPIGFEFPFYGNRFSTFRFSTNGFISFTITTSVRWNEPIPNLSVTDLVAPFWDDLIYDSDSDAFYHFDGEKCIIQSSGVRKYGTSERNSFEIILYPDGSIVFQYLLMQSSSASATVGIQNSDGSDGLEVAFNTPYLRDSLAIQFTNSVPWIKYEKDSGVVPQASSVTIPVMLTAKDIRIDSELFANIMILSNDVKKPLIVIPAEMRVITSEIVSGIVHEQGKALEGATVQAWQGYPNGTIIASDISDAVGAFALQCPPIGGIYTVRAYAANHFPAFKSNIPGNTKNVKLNLNRTPDVAGSREWVDFFSDKSRFWGGPVQPGDVITAIDPDSVVCGIFNVHIAGNYGFMPVYSDDNTTPDIDEGAVPGDTISFRINTFTAETLGPDAPVWSAHASLANVDLNVDEIDTVNIPLSPGLNLVSWNIDTPYDSSEVILADILPGVQVVLSFEQGGLIYDPEHPQFSNLHVMDHLHGYWIRMYAADTLVLAGNPVNYLQTPIHCEAGWNLVSFLPDKPDSTSHALSSIWQNLVRVLGYDDGGLTYDPLLPQFSTLNVMQPGFGYWLYLSADDLLFYPEPMPESPVAGLFDLAGLTNAMPAAGSKLIPSTEWINLYGENLQSDGQLFSVGTSIRAVDPDGVICGETSLTEAGCFGFMPVYRDDPRTQCDEGAIPGDELSIYINEIEVPITVIWNEAGAVVDLSRMISSVGVANDNLPKVFDLAKNYPNPFNPETTIKYQLPKATFAILKVYNLLGQQVRTLVDSEKKAGFYQVHWDGRNDAGSVVSSGIYLYKIDADGYHKTRKMLLLK
ncbi:S8 family serine peptidase [candidate division KSB1 bacterium]|nr:S8 family serine peptidase [candidate division KSB1 bacterium]